MDRPEWATNYKLEGYFTFIDTYETEDLGYAIPEHAYVLDRFSKLYIRGDLKYSPDPELMPGRYIDINTDLCKGELMSKGRSVVKKWSSLKIDDIEPDDLRFHMTQTMSGGTSLIAIKPNRHVDFSVFTVKRYMNVEDLSNRDFAEYLIRCFRAGRLQLHNQVLSGFKNGVWGFVESTNYFVFNFDLAEVATLSSIYKEYFELIVKYMQVNPKLDTVRLWSDLMYNHPIPITSDLEFQINHEKAIIAKAMTELPHADRVLFQLRKLNMMPTNTVEMAYIMNAWEDHCILADVPIDEIEPVTIEHILHIYSLPYFKSETRWKQLLLGIPNVVIMILRGYQRYVNWSTSNASKLYRSIEGATSYRMCVYLMSYLKFGVLIKFVQASAFSLGWFLVNGTHYMLTKPVSWAFWTCVLFSAPIIPALVSIGAFIVFSTFFSSIVRYVKRKKGVVPVYTDNPSFRLINNGQAIVKIIWQ
ncbi:hypothetical protein [Rhizoctonia solani fusarivirus 2]|uniref:Uncharacterized protein n=1 Tax=Rhizoctonia solani fusarivirus 2 TaxID=2599954 RepID=A0AAE6LTP0_9VIRU|nr:hypothetical protein QKQ62_gp2 [Rhizoctonia solani fusarivirus 2]QDW92690.1 hypothetical protein [Rhizoctonia solani fusarivirus 2]